jgi:hypothetical protein
MYQLCWEKIERRQLCSQQSNKTLIKNEENKFVSDRNVSIDTQLIASRTESSDESNAKAKRGKSFAIRSTKEYQNLSVFNWSNGIGEEIQERERERGRWSGGFCVGYNSVKKTTIAKIRRAERVEYRQDVFDVTRRKSTRKHALLSEKRVFLKESSLLCVRVGRQVAVDQV